MQLQAPWLSRSGSQIGIALPGLQAGRLGHSRIDDRDLGQYARTVDLAQGQRRVAGAEINALALEVLDGNVEWIAVAVLRAVEHEVEAERVADHDHLGVRLDGEQIADVAHCTLRLVDAVGEV